MTKLRELNKEQLSITVALRQIEIKASKRINDVTLKDELDRLTYLLENIMNKIMQHKQELIKEKFGIDTLNKFVEFEGLKKTNFISNSETRKKCNTLEKELKDVFEFIENAEKN
jgi:hypothetical protein